MAPSDAPAVVRPAPPGTTAAQPVRAAEPGLAARAAVRLASRAGLNPGPDRRAAVRIGTQADARRVRDGRRQVSARNKPSSVPLRGRIIHLGLPLPTASCGLPGTQAERATPRSLFGLASGGVCQRLAVTRSPVRSYRTLSPLPVPLGGHRRSTLCCTFRRLTTPGRYPAPCPVELGLSSGSRNHRRSSLARSGEC